MTIVADQAGLPRSGVVLAYALLSLVVLLPIAAVDVPMLSDYPNHLARMHVLATIDRSPILQSFYEVEWRLFPYLAMDAVVPWLARVMPIYDAGRAFIAACMLLPVAGVAAIHYVVHRRASLVPVGAFLFTYNHVLALGFMNYLFSVGLALLLLAGWIASERRSRAWRIIPFAAGATVLYLAHAYAFAAYCIAVAGFEIGRASRSGFRPLPTIATDWLAAASQAVPAVILALLVELKPHPGDPYLTSYGSSSAKLTALLSPVSFLGSRVDLAAGIVIVALFAGGLLTRRIRLSPVVAPIVAALVAVAVCIPEWLVGTWGADLRLPVVAALVLVSGVTIDLRPRASVALLAAVAALVALKAGHAAITLQAADRQVAELRLMLAQLPRGARLMVSSVKSGDATVKVAPHSMTAHAPLLATIDRDAFVPILFTELTTLKPRAAMRPISDTPQGTAVRMQDLLAERPAAAPRPAADSRGRVAYWHNWQADFDYLLWHHSGTTQPAPPPHVLQPVATGTAFNLYRIVRP